MNKKVLFPSILTLTVILVSLLFYFVYESKNVYAQNIAPTIADSGGGCTSDNDCPTCGSGDCLGHYTCLYNPILGYGQCTSDCNTEGNTCGTYDCPEGGSSYCNGDYSCSVPETGLKVCDASGNCVRDSSSCEASCEDCNERDGDYIAYTYCNVGEGKECGSGTVYEKRENRDYYCDSSLGECTYYVVRSWEVDTGQSCTKDCPSGLLCCSGKCQECCVDSDCPSGSVCVNGQCQVSGGGGGGGVETNCCDGVDNDNDGYIDICDTDCQGIKFVCGNTLYDSIGTCPPIKTADCPQDCKKDGYDGGNCETCGGGPGVCVCWKSLECTSDENCTGYDPNTHTKLVCECPAGPPTCTYKGNSYSCVPLQSCSSNDQCDEGFCCDADPNGPGGSGQCVSKGIYSTNSQYLCDPPNWVSVESEDIQVEKSKSFWDILISFFSSLIS